MKKLLIGLTLFTSISSFASVQEACRKDLKTNVTIDSSSIKCVTSQVEQFEGTLVKVCLAKLSESDESESPCGIVQYLQSHDDDGNLTAATCSCAGDWL